jgi:hypothetical protein
MCVHPKKAQVNGFHIVKFVHFRGIFCLLQGRILIPEAFSLWRLQHIYTSLQPCCVGHIPRNDGCLFLCATHHSESREWNWWLKRNTSIFIEWFFTNSYWNRLPRRFVLHWGSIVPLHKFHAFLPCKSGDWTETGHVVLHMYLCKYCMNFVRLVYCLWE